MKTETDLQIATKLLTDHVQQMVNKGILSKYQIQLYERIIDLLNSHADHADKYINHIRSENWKLSSTLGTKG